MHQAGRSREINEYCMFDTLDTYFVFLRTRVLTGDLTAEQERSLEARARDWLSAKAADQPALRQYLDAWRTPQPADAALPVPSFVSPPPAGGDPPQSP
jgi:hypothetical protein